MENKTEVKTCNTDSILKDAVIKFLLTADEEDLQEVFMEVAIDGGLNMINDIVADVREQYIEMHEQGI